mmetsp:Transcript_45944/g.89765  ORF Transcript_45944/g.89765 Transcript_45944/m.89765 type:complete len:282 (-) Transcript_45944:1277-2122(-)
MADHGVVPAMADVAAHPTDSAPLEFTGMHVHALLKGAVRGLCRQGVLLGHLDAAVRQALIFFPQGLRVANHKLQGLHRTFQMGGLGGIDAILPVQKLDDPPIRIPDGVVVTYLEVLQMLDETALQIPAPRRLDGRVDETLPAGHAVEVILLRPDPGEEPVRDESVGTGVRVVRRERRQGLPTGHPRHPPPLERLLPEGAGHLRLVHDGPLGARVHHERKRVVRKLHGEAVGQTAFDNVGRQRVDFALHVRIQAGGEGCAVLPVQERADLRAGGGQLEGLQG